MAKRRGSSGNEISLFPFLSILACLIGALVMIIVVLVISQVGKAEGRTMEEIQMAQDVQRMQKELDQREKDAAVVAEKLALLEDLEAQAKDKQQRFAKLRKLLDSSKDVQEQNKQISQELQKELDDLLVEIDGLKIAQTETKVEIKALLEELEKRKVPKDKQPPAVVVQPSGSGMPAGTKVYFVEAFSGQLRVLGAWGEDYRISAQPEVVVADHSFNYFLTEIQKDPKALVLFLVRDDGYGAYNNGAGHAQSLYGINVGKLPIPGRGELQLGMFDSMRGTMAPPPPPPEIPPEGAAPSGT